MYLPAQGLSAILFILFPAINPLFKGIFYCTNDSETGLHPQRAWHIVVKSALYNLDIQYMAKTTFGNFIKQNMVKTTLYKSIIQKMAVKQNQ